MSGEVETRSLPHRAFVMCVSLRLDSVPDLYLRREGSFGVKNGGSGPIRRPSGLPAIADVLLHCREPPLWANRRLSRCKKRPHYSMTSSAVASILGGTVRPTALAVLRLMTNSNLVGC
jgi:hypothetical protein